MIGYVVSLLLPLPETIPPPAPPLFANPSFFQERMIQHMQDFHIPWVTQEQIERMAWSISQIRLGSQGAFLHHLSKIKP